MAASKTKAGVRHVFPSFCRMESQNYCNSASCAIDNLSRRKYNGALRRGGGSLRIELEVPGQTASVFLALDRSAGRLSSPTTVWL
ncbi:MULTISPECIES: hypothetical protein [unclassified Duganella]|uniref:hypothetical protein n=1 Tax=unclassified Duganella TaxID=2636909 RepID=UPI0011C1BE75|nr:MULTISPECIES: hypothetical protein [unclassified Duganella]